MPEKLVSPTRRALQHVLQDGGFLPGIFVASPLILYQVWLFISPGLYRQEQRYVVPFLFSTVGLFIAGGSSATRWSIPRRWISCSVMANSSADDHHHEYTNLFMTIILGLGIVFEMPIWSSFLALMGVVSAGWMWRNLRYSILVIFIIAAIITPTTDIMNMCIFAAPMIVLYYCSIGVAYLVHPNRRNRKKKKALNE